MRVCACACLCLCACACVYLFVFVLVLVRDPPGINHVGELVHLILHRRHQLLRLQDVQMVKKPATFTSGDDA